MPYYSVSPHFNKYNGGIELPWLPIVLKVCVTVRHTVKLTEAVVVFAERDTNLVLHCRNYGFTE